jgi:hypothetical protein
MSLGVINHGMSLSVLYIQVPKVELAGTRSTKDDHNVLMLFLLWIIALEGNRITTLTITHINIWNLENIYTYKTITI